MLWVLWISVKEAKVRFAFRRRFVSRSLYIVKIWPLASVNQEIYISVHNDVLTLMEMILIPQMHFSAGNNPCFALLLAVYYHIAHADIQLSMNCTLNCIFVLTMKSLSSKSATLFCKLVLLLLHHMLTLYRLVLPIYFDHCLLW